MLLLGIDIGTSSIKAAVTSLLGSPAPSDRELLTIINEEADRLNRLQIKSLNGILAKQEKLACACSAQSLRNCKTIFIQPMPELLDQFLAAGVSKWGAIKVVETKEQADCVASYGREANRISERLGGNAAFPAENPYR